MGLGAKFDNLRLIPSTHIMEIENSLLQVVLTYTHKEKHK